MPRITARQVKILVKKYQKFDIFFAFGLTFFASICYIYMVRASWWGERGKS